MSKNEQIFKKVLLTDQYKSQTQGENLIEKAMPVKPIPRALLVQSASSSSTNQTQNSQYSSPTNSSTSNSQQNTKEED